MPLVVKDRVFENSTTTGTGTFTLSGAVTGYQTFSSAIGNGNTTYYTIANGTEWEVGIGTVGAGTLTRDTILESSNGGTAVNFSAGTKNVFCTYPAEKSVDIETAQTLSNKTLASPSVTGSITFGDSTTQSTAPTGFAFKNRIINGGMSIDQRNARASTAIADDTYCFDRWYVLTQTASINVSGQVNQENATPYNIRLTQNQASAQRMGLAQIIEYNNCVDLRGSSVVLNLRLRASNSQAIRYAILEWTGTADSATSDVVNSWTNTTYTTGNFFISTTTTVVAVGAITPSANTWTSLSTPLTGTISSSLNNLIVFIWTEGTAAQNFTLDISAVQLEKGSTATAFDYRPYTTELQLCQRYYETGTYNYRGGYANSSVIASVATPTYFKVTKRLAPTVTGTNVQGTFSAANIDVDGCMCGRSNVVADRINNGTFTAEIEL